MHDELARAAVAVPVAALLGLLIVRWSRSGAALLAGLVVLLALATTASRWQTWSAVAIGGAAAALMPQPSTRSKPSWPLIVIRILVLTIAATIVTTLLIDADATGGAIEAVGKDRDVAYVVLGALAAIFVGGEVIARIMSPLAARVDGADGASPVGLENAGRLIGWLERLLLYGLVLAGAPDAAALVIAGKSIARFPEFRSEAFAEYYLIGSFLSLAIAASAGIVIRALMGMTPLTSAIG